MAVALQFYVHCRFTVSEFFSFHIFLDVVTKSNNSIQALTFSSYLGEQNVRGKCLLPVIALYDALLAETYLNKYYMFQKTELSHFIAYNPILKDSHTTRRLQIPKSINYFSSFFQSRLVSISSFSFFHRYFKLYCKW